MSKIEVLRVPDEQGEFGYCCPQCNRTRLPTTVEQGFPDGSMLISNGLSEVRVTANEKPALLTAILEQAGAVKVTIDTKMDPEIPDGDYWLLLIRKEGGE